jgi:hypothetical protein
MGSEEGGGEEEGEEEGEMNLWLNGSIGWLEEFRQALNHTRASAELA